ncbi:MAG: trypsin-like peptidase domain-containing protein [Paracoccaceae bacterium]
MNDADLNPVAAALEHLTGDCRGQFSWITHDENEAWFEPGIPFRVTRMGRVVDGSKCVAIFRRKGDGFEVEATGACPIWVNRQPVERTDLSHGDMIEFGDSGPLSRIRIYSDRHRPDPTVSDILSDTTSYIRSSRRPLPVKLLRGVTGATRRVLFQTTVLFRVMVLLLLGAILGLLFWQWRTDQTLIASVDRQVSALASDVERTRAEALSPSDLAALREDVGGRLDTLEAQREAAQRVIAGAQESVVFLQAAYGLRHKASGRMLRHQVDAGGMPRVSPSGRPLFTLDGNGPVAEAQITGTGFLVDGMGKLVTNRHVALPWEEDEEDAPQEMEPVMVRFQAWFPSQSDPVPVVTVAVSDTADLAVLRMETRPESVRGLRIARDASSPGEAIIVMGYPTGLRSLLAQSGDAFVAALQADEETGFWEVAARLARANLIAPLSTRGIIGRVSEPTMVYDAETTSGGSGGPVLNMAGEVVAVNTAIIPEFGGSNLGVPAAHIHLLLERAAETQ